MYHSYLLKIGNSDTCIRFLDIQYIWLLPLNAVGKARSGCLEKRCREGAMLIIPVTGFTVCRIGSQAD